MIAPAGRLSRTDGVLIGIVAALAVASVASPELEYRAYSRWRGANPIRLARQPPESRWPAWIREWKWPAQRSLQAISAGLVTASAGLAFVAFRPGRAARPRRLGPGYVALAIAGALSVASAFDFIRWQWADPLLSGWGPRDEPGEPLLAWIGITDRVDVDLTWAMIPAWVYLASTGHWRRPLDPIDRLGRGLGWAWIVIIAARWAVARIP